MVLSVLFSTLRFAGVSWWLMRDMAAILTILKAGESEFTVHGAAEENERDKVMQTERGTLFRLHHYILSRPRSVCFTAARGLPKCAAGLPNLRVVLRTDTCYICSIYKAATDSTFHNCIQLQIPGIVMNSGVVVNSGFSRDGERGGGGAASSSFIFAARMNLSR
ncbi:hypothetical protein B0H12DRAFT_1098027 [Mycena haematopus]|nr:hypothetical protein B0H12DRAFT_1098027 [Mycena haematopus]